MRNKILFSLLMAIFVFGFWTCGNDKDKDEGCSAAWASELTEEANAMINAAQAYALNPNPTTCNAYKQAAQDYIDALEPYGNCATLTGQDRVEWQNAIDSAQDSLDDLTC